MTVFRHNKATPFGVDLFLSFCERGTCTGENLREEWVSSVSFCTLLCTRCGGVSLDRLEVFHSVWELFLELIVVSQLLAHTRCVLHHHLSLTHSAKGFEMAEYQSALLQSPTLIYYPPKPNADSVQAELWSPAKEPIWSMKGFESAYLLKK